ncbi:MAG: ROK family protein [Acetivibrio sp.]
MKILVIDIGGTAMKYACMGEDQKIYARGKVNTPKEDRQQLIEAIGRLYDEFPNIEGIAIAMPGIIDSDQGYCIMGGALRYNDDFYFCQSLYKRCPVKIHIENDAKCAAMAEAALGSLKDTADGFAIILGTMIGGAFIKDHKLHKGKHFSAGEVSYITTLRDGMPSYDTVWGNRGGTPYLCKLFAEKKGMDPAKVNGEMVFEAVNRGEEEARECLEQYTKEIAVQIFNLQTILDPERFAIGGGIGNQPMLIAYIKKNLQAMYAACPYPIPQAEVVACEFGNDANLMGALQCFLSENSGG